MLERSIYWRNTFREQPIVRRQHNYTSENVSKPRVSRSEIIHTFCSLTQFEIPNTICVNPNTFRNHFGWTRRRTFWTTMFMESGLHGGICRLVKRDHCRCPRSGAISINTRLHPQGRWPEGPLMKGTE